eukprot:5412246-Pleurochrysis_carterae.AAC.3
MHGALPEIAPPAEQCCFVIDTEQQFHSAPPHPKLQPSVSEWASFMHNVIISASERLLCSHVALRNLNRYLECNRSR